MLPITTPARPRSHTRRGFSLAVAATTLLAISSISGCRTVSEVPDSPTGAWISNLDGLRLDLHRDGTFTATPPAPREPVDGRWSIDGNRMTFRNDATAPVCPDLAGIYGWTLAEDVLYFTLVEDDCGPRREHMTGLFERARR